MLDDVKRLLFAQSETTGTCPRERELASMFITKLETYGRLKSVLVSDSD